MSSQNSSASSDDADIAIVGAGAAGLTAAIFAGQAAEGRGLKIVLLDSAKKPGAKILVSGGGRCNVTNHAVSPDDFSGGPRPIIRSVLRAFGERRTLDWMKSLGVELKLEPTGKYFPVTDEARTVLNALLARVREVGVELRSGARVVGIERIEKGFEVKIAGSDEREAPDSLRAKKLIAATGGFSLPKSGSDGRGIRMIEALGHSIVPTTPALVPLLLKPGLEPGGRFAELAGLTLPMRLSLHGMGGERLKEITGSLLFTHVGLSGPAALDFSRHWLRARAEHPEAQFNVCLGVPSLRTPEEADAWLRAEAARNPRRRVAAVLGELLPERLAVIIAGEEIPMSRLTRERRLQLARDLTVLPLAVIGDRGYAFAETTAGGIDLREIDPRTMESRKVPGLYLCGEMLDVDGRIGGFNFQWAWASGYLAGRGTVQAFQSAGDSPPRL